MLESTPENASSRRAKPSLPDRDHRSILTGYASGLMTAIGLFVLNNSWETAEVGSMPPAIAALAALKIFLKWALGLTSLTFLVLTVLTLSRSFLRRRYCWNSRDAEDMVLVAGLTAACYYAALGVVSYLLLLMVLTQLPLPVSDLIWWSCWLLWVLCWAIALLGIRYERGRLMRWGFWGMGAAFFVIGLCLS